jgi:hypothetical protein
MPDYDPLALDATERRFWGDLWRAGPADVAAAHGIELRTFGPLQATFVRDLAPVRTMNLLLGAAEADAEQLAAGLDWAASTGVDWRGCQTALLRRRIRDAAAAGCETLLVETGERTGDRPSASYRNILRAGFREAYVRPNWVVHRAAA